MINNKQSGFSVVETLVMLLLIFVVGGVGYYIYQNQQSEPLQTSQPDKQDVDSTKTISYSYPANWQLKPYQWDDCCEGLQQPEPDWSNVTKPITLYPAENESVTITIYTEMYSDYWSSYESLKASVKEDYFASILFEGVREDGHEALFSRVDYIGPPDAKVESFTDHRYYFDNDQTVLRVQFREKYHHDWYPENEVDNSQYKADFEKIANSIKFN